MNRDPHHPRGTSISSAVFAVMRDGRRRTRYEMQAEVSAIMGYPVEWATLSAKWRDLKLDCGYPIVSTRNDSSIRYACAEYVRHSEVIDGDWLYWLTEVSEADLDKVPTTERQQEMALAYGGT